ncbi:hypothetical protein [Sphingomonas flavalba]|uniref:hypothetical protein n=1 Tax=Sphingomonas flavalba TaxID=2559804 RepID=UPI00109D89EE|nr:hypothetical protein [Sphingomonas flavalba]
MAANVILSMIFPSFVPFRTRKPYARLHERPSTSLFIEAFVLADAVFRPGSAAFGGVLVD